MRSGTVWESICTFCDRKASYTEAWQEEAPSGSAPHDGGCCDMAWAEHSMRVARWESTFIPSHGPNQGGLVAPMLPEIPDHYNQSLGTRIHSRAHLEHVQRERGVEDAVVKGDGAERHVPRDIADRLKHVRKVSEHIDRHGMTDMGGRG